MQPLEMVAAPVITVAERVRSTETDGGRGGTTER